VRRGHLRFWARLLGLRRRPDKDHLGGRRGDYVENLRTIFLYLSAAQSRDTLPRLPGGRRRPVHVLSRIAGTGSRPATGSGTCACSLAANLSAGLPGLNDPVFPALPEQRQQHRDLDHAALPGHQGLCVPETMRFNGNGTYNGGTDKRLL
jgi:hypothetical protein